MVHYSEVEDKDHLSQWNSFSVGMFKLNTISFLHWQMAPRLSRHQMRFELRKRPRSLRNLNDIVFWRRISADVEELCKHFMIWSRNCLMFLQKWQRRADSGLIGLIIIIQVKIFQIRFKLISRQKTKHFMRSRHTVLEPFKWRNLK